MSVQKRNEWLDVGGSDEDDDQGYDSEAAEERKTERSSKRRKVEHDDTDASEAASEDEDVPHPLSTLSVPTPAIADTADTDASITALPGRSLAPRRIRTPSPVIPSTRAVSRAPANPSKTGVIYLSRIPPYMQPSALRTKLAPFGPIGRVFLQPEDPTAYARRKKAGGNKKRSFTDGWVEFLRKRDAKLAAAQLNAQIVGGKKGSWYHDDVWNIRYLKGFKWGHLTEQIANETAERSARLRAEIGADARENRRFVDEVEKAKMMRTGEKRERERQGEGEVSTEGQEEEGTKRKRKVFKSEFRQSEVKRKSGKGLEGQKPGEDAQRVLSRIF